MAESEREPETQDCRTTPQACQVTMPKKPSSVARLMRSSSARALTDFSRT